MAEERIDVVVDDKVDGNVEKKLRGIASGADKGFTSVQKLKSALADINVTSVTKLADASAKVTNALAREMNAQARLTTVRDKSALADAKAAISAQRLAAETAKTEAAQSRAAAAALRLQGAQDRAAAAQQKAADRANALKASQDALQAELDATNQKAAAGITYMERYAASLAKAAQASGGIGNAPAMPTPGVGQLPPGGFKKIVEEQDNVTKSSKAMGHQTANVIAQFNDLGVQFSMAAASSKPLQGIFMALIQQGSQLSYIAGQMEGGWRGIAALAGSLVVKFAGVLAILGLVTLAFQQFTKSLNEDSGLKEYVDTLGLTEKELKKLEDQHITTTDVLKSVWTELSSNLLSSMGLTTDEIATFWSNLAHDIVLFLKYAFIGIGALTVTLVKTLAKVTANIGIMFYNAGIAAKNLFLMSIEFLVNKTIDGINAIGDGINWLSSAAGLGNVVGKMNKIDLGIKGAGQGMKELFDIDPVGDFNKAAQASADTLDRIGKGAEANARKRLKADADALKAARGDGPKGSKPAVDKTAENRAHALDMVNKKLDDELSRMKLLKDERAIQQRFDQIEQELAQKKIKLNDTEAASIRTKIKAIEDYKYVQSEMDRILEDVEAPMRTLNAITDAAADLFDRGKISAERYNEELNKAGRAYEEATNPLFAMNEAVDANLKTAKLYGVQLEKANYLESIRQIYLKEGKELYDKNTGALNAEVAALVAKNDALRQQQYIQSQVSAIVDPMLQEQMMLDNKAAFYAEVERLRQKDVLSEQQANQAKLALDAKFSEMRLAGAKSFFGELAGLSSSGNKKLAAIGKAAAVAQATIDGYLAVQKALASGPPPWNFAMAAAVAFKTGAQVAGILSTNVGSFATGGQFMVDGRGGIDNNNINMNVSRGERVTIETPQQQRAADGTTPGTPAVVKTKIVNMFDEREFVGAMDTEEGEEVVMNILRRRMSDTKGILGLGE